MIRSFSLAVALFWIATGSHAETILAGERDALSVTTRDAAIDEVLGVLAERFDLRYRTGTPLTRQLNGNYSCPLQRCLAQILDGYDYIIRVGAGRVEVIVLGAAGAPKSPTASGAFAAHSARRAD